MPIECLRSLEQPRRSSSPGGGTEGLSLDSLGGSPPAPREGRAAESNRRRSAREAPRSPRGVSLLLLLLLLRPLATDPRDARAGIRSARRKRSQLLGEPQGGRGGRWPFRRRFPCPAPGWSGRRGASNPQKRWCSWVWSPEDVISHPGAWGSRRRTRALGANPDANFEELWQHPSQDLVGSLPRLRTCSLAMDL